MIAYIPGAPVTGGFAVAPLSLVEQRVTNALLIQMTNTADNNINTLRNDEAPALGLTVPIPSA